jgi:S-phase kinase-associated protein 1
MGDTVTLRSSDSVEYVVPADAAAESAVVRGFLEMMDPGSVMPVQVPSSSLAMVVDFMRDRSAFRMPTSREDLLDLVVAANYLNMGELLDRACEVVADIIKGKSPAEIRAMFGLENAYSPEEEDQIRRHNAWAFA